MFEAKKKYCYSNIEKFARYKQWQGAVAKVNEKIINLVNWVRSLWEKRFSFFSFPFFGYLLRAASIDLITKFFLYFSAHLAPRKYDKGSFRTQPVSSWHWYLVFGVLFQFQFQVDDTICFRTLHTGTFCAHKILINQSRIENNGDVLHLIFRFMSIFFFFTFPHLFGNMAFC